MSTLNNIIKKISVESKTELSKHQVELAVIDDLNILINNANDLYSEFVKNDAAIKPNLIKAQEEAKKAFSVLNKYILNIEEAKKAIKIGRAHV